MIRKLDGFYDRYKRSNKLMRLFASSVVSQTVTALSRGSHFELALEALQCYTQPSLATTIALISCWTAFQNTVEPRLSAVPEAEDSASRSCSRSKSILHAKHQRFELFARGKMSSRGQGSREKGSSFWPQRQQPTARVFRWRLCDAVVLAGFF